MRIKKDPQIRQEVFIQAATELFMEKGYEGVSVRDILDAVADKSASPSVFYYYFDSKEAIYHACVRDVAERYLEGFRKLLDRDYPSEAEHMLAFVDLIRNAIATKRKIMLADSSLQSKMFILDMREYVTREIAELCAQAMVSSTSHKDFDVRRLTQFIAGGIGHMIYSFNISEEQGKESLDRMLKDLVFFSMRTLGVPSTIMSEMLSLLDVHFASVDPFIS